MNAMPSSIRRHHIAKVVLSLLIVALVAGTTGCVGEASRTVKYNLTIASGEGGSVTEPGEGTFACDSGRVVDLVATPTSGYRFLKWTGNVATIANLNAASTTITMNGNYSITASFEETEGTYYSLTVGVTGSGSTSPMAGQHTYAAGAVISISATPAGGYHFVNWTGNVGSVANVNAASTTITMNSNYSITANFEQTAVTYYTLTVAATGGGSINPTVGQHSYAAGTVVPIIASATGGYYFVNWTGSVGTIANVNAASTTITMNGNYSITANFAVIPAGQYSLTISSGVGGSVTTPGEGTFIYGSGTVVNLVATPSGSYEFVNWTGNVGTIANVNAASTTITMNGNYEITANFYAGPPVPYNLTISSGAGGSVTSPGEGTFGYGSGMVVNLVATPASDYQFVNWTGNVGSVANVTAASTTITMNSNYSIAANFAVIPPGQYSLTISSTAGGSVTTPGEGTFPRNAGTVVNLVATPASGYQFVNWTGNVATVANVNGASTTIYMNSNYSITANFAVIPPVQYSLTISSTAGGSVTTPGEGTFTRNAGTVVNLVATPAAGFRFANWIGQVGTIADLKAASTTITMNGNYGITAAFAPRFMASAGGYHTVGLRATGTVVAVGYNGNGQCNVGGWTNITQVAAGDLHTVGLRSNGSVVAVGGNGNGQCNVGGWTNIIQVAAGAYHTVGLRSDGTVVAVGDNGNGQCNVGGWTNIIQVAAGAYHTLGLKFDGTVVAVGNNNQEQCNVGAWTGIIQVSGGLYHSVGLKSDGTLVAVGDNGAGQSNVSSWTNIIQVSAG
jgi:methionine-rich copper-binding protein CopC